MKSTTIQKFVQNAIAPLGVFCLLGLLAGCGGGGGISNPIALPIPTPTASVSRVTAQAVSLPVPGSTPIVAVQWPAPSFVSTKDVVEYHIYRGSGDVIDIVGVVPKTTFAFTDEGTSTSFTYFAPSPNDATKLVNTTVKRAWLSSGLFFYEVTALYVTPESASSATPVYAEKVIGVSERLTL